MWQVLDFDKVILISDVHGYYKTLSSLINKLELQYPDHKIIVLGDLIDKGKKSKEVVELIKKNHFALLGNHDLFMLLNSNPNLWTDPYSLWNINNGKRTQRSYGGRWKLKNYPDYKRIFREHVEWLGSLPMVIHLPNIKINKKELHLSHADLNNSLFEFNGLENLKNSLINNKRSEVITNYEESKFSNILWNSIRKEEHEDTKKIFNVFGHFAQDEVILEENYACIDTRVYNDNKLSSLVLPEMKIVSVDSIEDNWKD